MNAFIKLADFSDKLAFIDGAGNSVSYGVLDQLTQCLIEKLPSKKSLVIIFCRNDIETLLGYLSVLQSHHAALLVDEKLEKSLIQKIMDQYQPEFVWSLHDMSGEVIHTHNQYHLFKMSYDRSDRPTFIHPDLKLLLPTSGSTGTSKFVRLSLKNIISNATAIANYLKLNDFERPITSLPIYYSYGLSVIHSHLLIGATILLTDLPITVRAFWDFFNEYAATSLSGVPYTYDLFRKFRLNTLSFPSLRTITQAGGKMNKETLHFMMDFCKQQKIQLFVMYGQTEATARITYTPPDRLYEKLGTIGIPIPGGELNVVNLENHLPVSAHQEGELIYVGDNVMLGYAESRADLSLGDNLLRKLPTGDIGYCDEDGFFYITGRLKRFIKIAGNRVSLDALENDLKIIFGELVCGGRDDQLQIGVLDEAVISPLKAILSNTYHFHHTLFTIVTISEIPKNTVGKAQYHQIFTGTK